MRVVASLMIAAAVGLASVGSGAGDEPTSPEVPTPTAPVLLVPGWFDTDRELAALRIRMIAAGWSGEEVKTLSFGSPTGSNRVHAMEIAEAVRSLQEETGAKQVDVVAHSMGGLATRWYLMREGGAAVRRVAFIASPHRGTYTAYLAWGEGRLEMKPGSAFLDTLNSALAVPLEVQAITIWTPLDTHIIPNSSARLVGFPDYRVCCPTHAGLIRDAEVFTVIRRFLEDGYDKSQ